MKTIPDPMILPFCKPQPLFVSALAIIIANTNSYSQLPRLYCFSETLKNPFQSYFKPTITLQPCSKDLSVAKGMSNAGSL